MDRGVEMYVHCYGCDLGVLRGMCTLGVLRGWGVEGMNALGC